MTWRSQDQKKYEYSDKLKTAFGRASAFRLRDAFHWWKKKFELQELEQDMYDSGPVRVEYAQAM